MTEERVFDVAIVGSGLAGSMLAAILARQGKTVLLLEAGSHPRFAIGESVVPEFGARARVMAEAFGVPELAHISTFQWLRHHVSANCGIKRSFSFLVHKDGEEHPAHDTSQFQTMTYPLGPDSHIYRPDLDSWLTSLAIRYGATYKERAPVKDIVCDGDGVTIATAAGDYRAQFVADSSGFRSVLASKYGLRREVDLKTNTRSIFTHMVGVGRIADARRDGQLRIPSPPDQGTAHHLFDGGWFWVIPFDNHSGAVNPLCSVGLTLDRARHPDNDDDAQEEFFRFVNRFPTVARQFEGARAVRSWVKTGRIQYQSERLAGDRWCLLPHAAGFVDALFSGGMVLTLIGVDEVARVLLEALAENRFDAARFADIEEGTRDNQAVLDKMVHGAFLSFRSHALFNAWFRIWAVGNFHSSAAMIRLHLKYVSTKNREYLDLVRRAPYRRVLGMDQPRLRALLDDGYAILERLERAELTEPQAIDEIYALLGRQEWIPPHFHITERERGHLASFTVFPLLSLMRWGKRRAPKDMREVYYDVGPVFFRELTKSLGREGWRNFSSFLRVVRDAHYTRGRS